MSFQIQGLNPEQFQNLIGLSDTELALQNAVRVVATAKPGFPCRVSLEDAEIGESLILFNFVSHDVATPYRSAYAIYVREKAKIAPVFSNEVPPVFKGRPLGLRAFDASGMLRNAALAGPGEAAAKIEQLFSATEIAYIDAHNAAHGCFVARVTRI